MADEILGFKEVEGGVPEETKGVRGQSKYDPLIMGAREGKTFVRDMGSKRAAQSLLASINVLLRRREISDVRVSLRGTKVYVSLRKER